LLPSFLGVAILMCSQAPADADAAPKTWIFKPFSEFEAALERDGWKKQSGTLIKFHDGEKVAWMRLEDGDQKPLKNGVIRQTFVVLTAPIDFPPGKEKFAHWVDRTPDSPWDKIALGFENGKQFVDSLERVPAAIQYLGTFDKQDLDPEPVGRARMSISLTPHENLTRRLVYLQRKLELRDGENVVGVWYEQAFAMTAFTKDLRKKDGAKKNAP
jgi:hypothetical protein